DRGAWSAPVYFGFKHRCFYFFSSPKARHIVDSLPGCREAVCPENSGKIQNCFSVGVSIFLDADSFQGIKGLQMGGTIQAAEKKEAVAAAAAYVKKYRLAMTEKNALGIIMEKYRACLYRFVPESVYYMDNAAGLGTRTRVTL
ncbi:MAG: hypothetical protein R6V54_06075, partial [Desulfobacteraceae bacterium]